MFSMVSKIKSFIAACILSLSLPGISTGTDLPIYRDTNNIIHVNQASSAFEITLPSNRTTGYRWKIKNYDETKLTLSGANYVPPVSELAGAGSEMNFIFEVNPDKLKQAQAFETHISFVYERPWSPEEKPTSKLFTVRFDAKPEDKVTPNTQAVK